MMQKLEAGVSNLMFTIKTAFLIESATQVKNKNEQKLMGTSFFSIFIFIRAKWYTNLFNLTFCSGGLNIKVSLKTIASYTLAMILEVLSTRH